MKPASQPATPTKKSYKDPTIKIMIAFSLLFFGGIAAMAIAPPGLKGPIISLVCVGVTWFMIKGV
ncbi:MAG: hypothetical protein KC474_09300 [Cyanobacteria bacterium HKST-UBA04]|nr:hypothetical protein [Cyanobacteria bacterium HKST-UBA05]MCA9799736.1 hypothetical protein [Cyanobacteria bacterium HKST-UBA04]MCA9840709.1 hypothetical protein [Cyanobacteria bacterium HKST-UBA03]